MKMKTKEKSKVNYALLLSLTQKTSTQPQGISSQLSDSSPMPLDVFSATLALLRPLFNLARSVRICLFMT